MDALLESMPLFPQSIFNLQMFIGIFLVQSELVKKGKKRLETLRISEEEAMLNNHRCCY